MFRLLDQPPEASTKINIYVNQNLLIIRNTFFFIYSVIIDTVELIDILFMLCSLWGLFIGKNIPFTHGVLENKFITLTQYAFIEL